MPNLLQTALIVYLLLVAIMSVVCFFAYGLDKYKAKRASWRIPEKSLQMLALLGGWPGALLGQNLFRHKTQKKSFRMVFWLMVLLHIIVVAAIGYLLVRWSESAS